MANTLRSCWRVVRDHRRAYVVLNVTYYALVALGMMYSAFVDPTLQAQLLQDIGGAFTEGPLATVGGAYLAGNVLAATVLTFLVNLLAGSLLYITVPSLVVPFAGLTIGFFRAVLWGLILAPTTTDLALIMIPHSLTLLLEGQGYILAMLAVYVHGKSLLRPASVGATGRVQGYVTGLKLSLRLYVLVAIVLAAAAIYEAVSLGIIVRLAAAAGG
jgi:hypothetical protein